MTRIFGVPDGPAHDAGWSGVKESVKKRTSRPGVKKCAGRSGEERWTVRRGAPDGPVSHTGLSGDNRRTVRCYAGRYNPRMKISRTDADTSTGRSGACIRRMVRRHIAGCSNGPVTASLGGGPKSERRMVRR